MENRYTSNPSRLKTLIFKLLQIKEVDNDYEGEVLKIEIAAFKNQWSGT